jgi:Uma2 family endonuclease
MLMKNPENQFEHENVLAGEPSFDYSAEYTYGDYLKFEFEEMVELIRGKIFRMSPAPKINHQRISGKLFTLIHNHLKDYKNCEVFHAPTDVVLPIENLKRLDSKTVVQPDIFVICDKKIIEKTAVFGVPNLVIEIISGKSIKKDTQIKYDLYEEAGVGEYWIVFAESQFVEVYVLENGKYLNKGRFSEGDEVPVKTLPGLSINTNDVFKGLD